MREAALRIGFLGPIGPKSSSHWRSIFCAVEVLRTRHPAFASGTAELVVFDDGASAAGGKSAARKLVAENVDVAAGLFSSDAAMSALPLLSQHGVEIVIAGANADSLTRFPGSLRVCDTSLDYADWIANVAFDCCLDQVIVHCENSNLGRAMAERLEHLASCGNASGTGLAIIIGQYEFAKQALLGLASQLRDGDIVLLSDDCQLLERVVAIREAIPVQIEIVVAGFSGSYTQGRSWARDAATKILGKPPGAFFHESIASVEVALLRAQGLDNCSVMATVLGDLAFDEDGEARPRRMALHRLNAGRLEETLTIVRED